MVPWGWVFLQKVGDRGRRGGGEEGGEGGLELKTSLDSDC